MEANLYPWQSAYRYYYSYTYAGLRALQGILRVPVVGSIICKPEDASKCVERYIAMLNNIFLFPIPKFYSRIVIKKMDVDQLSNIRKVETLLKLLTRTTRFKRNIRKFAANKSELEQEEDVWTEMAYFCHNKLNFWLTIIKLRVNWYIVNEINKIPTELMKFRPIGQVFWNKKLVYLSKLN